MPHGHLPPLLPVVTVPSWPRLLHLLLHLLLLLLLLLHQQLRLLPNLLLPQLPPLPLPPR